MNLEQNNAVQCAHMVRIRFTPEEAAMYQTQLQELFNWVKELSAVDVSGVELSASQRAAYLRPDVPVRDEARAAQLVAAFSDQEDHCAKVKKVL